MYILHRTLAILQTIFNVQRKLNIKGACVYVPAYLHYFIHLFVLLFACPFMHLYVCLSVCLSTHWSFCMYICSAAHLLASLSACLLYICRAVCTSNFDYSQLLDVLKSVHVSLSSSVVFTNEIFIVKQNEVA